MIEAVLFDYGLVLSGPADPASWAEMRRISMLEEESLQQAYWVPRHAYDRGTHTGAEYWRLVGRHGGVDFSQEQIASLLEADVALWTTPNPPMIAWAARLQRAGTRIGVLSNLGDEMTKGVLTRMPWLNSFHHRTFSHAVKLAKPEVEIYKLAADGLGVDPGAILFIDDRTENCEAGRRAGMQVMQYHGHEAFLLEMEARGLTSLWATGKTG